MADIEAHITGNVWKIEVAVGDQVSDGDTVVILESKKMEIPVKRLIEGADVGIVLNPDSMANPEVIEEFVRVAHELTVYEKSRLETSP